MAKKVKKPFYKKWWVWLIAIIIIIGFATGGGDEEKVADKKSEPASGQVKEDNKEAKSKDKKKEAKTFAVGDTVEVGKMTYVINSMEAADQVGPSILPETASGKYIVIDATLKNNGDEAVTVDSNFFKLKRGEKTYEADSGASMSANQGEDGNIDNSFFLQQLNPDSEITGKVVFDVAPEVADADDLQLQVQTGVFGTETETINLN